MNEKLVPPNNQKAEIQVIGSLLMDPECLDSVMDVLSKNDFYLPRHQIIYEAIQALVSRRMAVDLITVLSELDRTGLITTIGGPEYLSQLAEDTISTSNLDTYCSIVREKSMQRKIISTCKDIQVKAFNSDFPTLNELIDFAQGKVFALDDDKSSQSTLVDTLTIIKSTIPEIERRSKLETSLIGISTGYQNLDQLTQGLKPGEVVVIAARPSMGKTALSLNLAHNIGVIGGKKLAYFSIEMPKEQLVMRMLASGTGIDMGRLSSGKIHDNEWSKLIKVAGEIAEAKIYIDDSASLSPFELRSRCRWLKATEGLDCVMIDYLQLMRIKSGKIESKEREVAEISQTIKAISKELGIPVVALAQLNREADKRPDKRPLISDLRDSGSIEMDADVIMMLYREDYYDRENPDIKGNAEVIIGKNRNGQTGVAKMKFKADCNRFEERGFAG